MMILDILVTLLALATIASYLWSVKFHFESGALEAGAKLISAMVIIGAITFTGLTWAQEQPAVFQLLGGSTAMPVLVAFLDHYWRDAQRKSVSRIYREESG